MSMHQTLQKIVYIACFKGLDLYIDKQLNFVIAIIAGFRNSLLYLLLIGHASIGTILKSINMIEGIWKNLEPAYQ